MAAKRGSTSTDCAIVDHAGDTDVVDPFHIRQHPKDSEDAGKMRAEPERRRMVAVVPEFAGPWLHSVFVNRSFNDVEPLQRELASHIVIDNRAGVFAAN